ncbi:TPA: hypothetical protein L5623_006097 [Pseudomonas aeruginosa]|jgi:hypothetical protein|nr:hypothetical protein [Pseudomonas aeruginosa]
MIDKRMLHHLDWIHGFDASDLNEPDERQGGTWLSLDVCRPTTCPSSLTSRARRMG